MKPAPIALFVYNRPVHARRTVEALLKNEPAAESDLIIFSDAAKKPGAADAVQEVRDYIRTISGFRSVRIVEREKNWGLADSIINGVTSVVNEHGRIIVLEDDLVVSPHFLEYMNVALEHYQDDERVMQISGHVFPVQFTATTDAVFLPMTTSWGWATWARAWKYFDAEVKGYAKLEQDATLRKRFNLDGSYDYFSMLEEQRAGRVDSWAVLWYLSVFMRGGLTLFPVKSLVDNFGFDGSGTHCGAMELTAEFTKDFSVKTFPAVVANESVQQAINSYLAKPHDKRVSKWSRLVNWL